MAHAISRTAVRLIAILALSLPVLRPAFAGEVTVAVAANFTEAAREIAAAFTSETGHSATLSFGSTGQLYAQITQAAPFDVFLAADQARPAKAVESGLAVANSRFTYATGKIVLYSTDASLVDGPETLAKGNFNKIAIANPATAPYGVAAVAAMTELGVYDALKAKIVEGKNIAQTYQFVATGNAEVGFVAQSQINLRNDGSRWLVPERLYPPIAQDAVLLQHGAGSPAARAFMDFLRSAAADAVKANYGYGRGE